MRKQAATTIAQVPRARLATLELKPCKFNPLNLAHINLTSEFNAFFHTLCSSHAFIS